MHKEHEEGTKLHKGISLSPFMVALCLLWYGFFMLIACDKKDISPVESQATIAAKIYYVAPGGNDMNPGTQSSPLKTITRALAIAVPSDTVLVRAGIYRERVVFFKSGEPDKPITLVAYPGETPVISGEGLTATGTDALVRMNSVHYITIEGFDIRDLKTTTAAGVDGIKVSGTSSHVTIRKNKIYEIKHNGTTDNYLRSAHGIHVIGDPKSAPITNILIEENEIHDCNTGFSENVTINGNVDGFIFRKNKVYNGENIGVIIADGGGAYAEVNNNYARNGVVSENEVFTILGQSGPIPVYQGTYGPAGIYICGARSIIVERNLVHDNDRGIGLVSENNLFPTQDCTVRNNFVYNNNAVGIFLGDYDGWTGGGTKNSFIVNNTLFYNNKEIGYNNTIEGEIRLTVDCYDNTIKNNILYVRPERGVFINKQNSGGSNNVIDHNLYYTTGTITKWIWDASPKNNFTDWKSACNGDASSTCNIDPQLKSTTIPDLHLGSTSPASNTGVVISSTVNGEMDIDGQPRIINNLISKGAHQNQ